jgi:predicted MPP superfamily phosphohydrolase
MTVLIIALIFLLVDFYVYQAVIEVSKNFSQVWKNISRLLFWIPTALSAAVILWYFFGDPYSLSAKAKTFIFTGIVAIYLSKIFAVLVLFIDDVRRGIQGIARMFEKKSPEALPGQPITRSEFLSTTALVVGAVPLAAMTFGIISGAHDYRVRRKTIYLPRLPKAFDGIRIAQVSDIHSGSFWNKTAVQGGVDMLLNEKPDVIFFTGDLVNNEASEVRDYVPIFGKLKAPLGVYSITGNHDYGDYQAWRSVEAKRRNFQSLLQAHRDMGYHILMNDHAMLEQGGEKIAVLGIENWGAGRFSKYGKLDEAYRGTEDAAVKLLLSHDPSHWDAQVRPLYPDIDVMFSGHTHGFQFGVEIGNFKWSPSQYVYKQWAGLYQEGHQYLYVNRGYGYLGYPGRIGMPPEITMIELKKA